MGGLASSTTAEIYMQAYERTAITTVLHPPKDWERFVDDVYSILKRTHLENFFHHINNFHQNINFTMEEESNGELAFLDNLLKRNNGEISILVYRKPTNAGQYLHYSSHHQKSWKESVVSSLFNTEYSIIKRNHGEISILVYRKPTNADQYLHYSSHRQKSCKESVVSSLFNTEYSIIKNKDDLRKENARIKQVLKENGCQESIINKIFRRITNNHSLPQLQHKPQISKRKRSE